MKESQVATTKNSQNNKLTNSQLCIEVALVLVALYAVFQLLALLSFDPADPGWSQTAWHEPIHNWGGRIGAYTSDILLQFFGYVAYALPLLVILLCAQLARYFYRDYDQPFNYFSAALRLIGVLTFVFGATGFLAMNVNDSEQFQAGGILGTVLAGELYPLLGHIGASILLLALWMSSITLLTSWSWLTIVEKIGQLIVAVTQPIFNLFSKITSTKSNSTIAENNLNEAEPKLDPLGVQTELDLASAQVEVEPAAEWPQTEFTSSALTDVAPDEPPAESATVESLAAERSRLSTSALVAAALEAQANQSESVETRTEASAESAEQANTVWPTSTTATEQSWPEQSDATETEAQSETITDWQSDSQPEEHQIADFPLTTAGGFIPAETVATATEIAPPETAAEPQPTPLENAQDSLIHPLLMKNEQPLVKPTTPLPSLSLLTEPPQRRGQVDHQALQSMAALIEKSLADFRIKARVVDYLPGPVITRFELALAPGVKAARITNLDRDLARSLSMPSVRVVEVIPGKPYVGLELPNAYRETVYFREVLDSEQFKQAKSPLTVVLGKDIAGQSVVADLAKMPHLLVAGTTGSGKSVGVNAMILSILYKSKPDDVRFIMIDPKMLELSIYEGIPHLLTEVVTDMKDAANALNWCVNEMERRYRLMSVLGVRNIAGYNDKIKLAEEMGRPIPDPIWRPGDSMDVEHPMLEKLPYIVVMVDEFADLIMAVGKKVEELIARLAQKARAAGIHLVLATQRPSVDVITGLIKANIPTRIAFTVSSKIDSRTILDQMGAESLLGMGDMLYLAPNSSIPVRVHGAFVRDEEVHAVVQDWKARGTPKYIENITAGTEESSEGGSFESSEERDALFDQVVEFVAEKRRVSISSVQRQFRIGYNRAARIVEQMEAEGMITPPNHSGNREVLLPPPSNF